MDIDEVDISDPPTYALYSEGRTIGTFQFESAGMQKYLRELEPSTFEDLIAMNALYRPGPMDYIPDFIDRKHGRKPIEYLRRFGRTGKSSLLMHSINLMLLVIRGWLIRQLF